MEHSPGFLKLVSDAKTRIRETTPEEVRRRRQAGARFHLVDVREDHEWQQAHVAGAMHLGKGIIERDIEKTLPDPEAEIVLYCGGGFRSALAAEALQKMGYRNVTSMDGGWRRWCELGYPRETAEDLASALAAVAGRSTLDITVRGRRTGKPHTKPIWFVVEGSTVYLATLSARRDWVRNAQKNPDVELACGGLRVRGRLGTVGDPALEAHIRALLARKYRMAWLGSWFGAGPERTFRVDGLERAAAR